MKPKHIIVNDELHQTIKERSRKLETTIETETEKLLKFGLENIDKKGEKCE